MQNFAYLVEDERSREAMAIDSGWDIEPIVRIASGEGMRVKYVCATHGHYDHVDTIGRLASQLGAATVAFKGSDVDPDVGVIDGDILRLGESEVKVVYT